MKKLWLTSILCLTIFACASSCTMAQETESVQNDEMKIYEVGDKVDDFNVTLCDGSKVSLYDKLEESDAVFLYLWATYCTACKQEFPAINSASEKYPEIYVLAVSAFEEDDDKAAAALKEDMGLNFDMAAYNGSFVDEYYDLGIPTSCMITKDGVICWKEAGSIPDESVFERLFASFKGAADSSAFKDFKIPPASSKDFGVTGSATEEPAAALKLEGDITITENGPLETQEDVSETETTEETAEVITEETAEVITGETAKETIEETTEDNGFTYKIIDTDGAPVEGASLLACTSETCTMFASDPEGLVKMEPQEYSHIQLFSLPEGYSIENNELSTPSQNAMITVVVNKD